MSKSCCLALGPEFDSIDPHGRRKLTSPCCSLTSTCMLYTHLVPYIQNVLKCNEAVVVKQTNKSQIYSLDEDVGKTSKLFHFLTYI